MKADLSRSTFDPAKHFRDVRLQQGRVQLDADFNEYVDIVARRIETGTRDVVGNCGAPRDAAGFALAPAPGAAGDFLLSAGRYYVDGLLVENDTDLKFSAQAAGDFPGAAALATPGLYLAYLDVWLRHLTHLDDEALREKALNGPDTATRLKTVWQVRLARVGKLGDPRDCGGEFPEFNQATAVPTGKLSADVDPTLPDDKPCELPPNGGYRRLENQLYRVEVHQGGDADAGATFKWSRDNGTVVSDWAPVTGEPQKIQLLHPPRDEVLGFARGQWVELLDDTNDLNATPGDLRLVENVEGDTLVFTTPAPALARHPKVRRWDSAGALPITTAAPIALEDGVLVSFTAGSYRTGDYWMIPARTVTADVEWPREDPADDTSPRRALLPFGIEHHCCRLGFVEFDGSKITTSDCRCLFSPLAEPRLEMVGGDGQEVMPDLTQPTVAVRLPEPIAVFVENLHCGDGPLSLRFTVEPASDELQLLGGSGASATGGVLIVPAPEAGGVVECAWRLRPSVIPAEPPAAPLTDPFTDAPGGDVRRYVKVECVNAKGDAVESPHPLLFTARLSVASQVAYDPGKCAPFADRKNVQDAIDLLVGMTSLYKVSGDGGIGRPGETRTLTVLAANRCGPAGKMAVQFTVLSGGGSIAPATGATGSDGRLSAAWQLGRQTDVQIAMAELVAAESSRPITEPTRVVFIVPVGGDPAPLHIEKLVVGKERRPLSNDDKTPLTIDDLVAGILISFDREVDPATIVDPASETKELITRGQPTCFVTLEMPYLDTLQYDVVGLAMFQPFILWAKVQAKENVVLWQLDRRAALILAQWLAGAQTLRPAIDRILLRLTLKGNFIWSSIAREAFAKEMPGGFLDGETWRAPEKFSPSQLILPSGDCRRGGDFEMWFWLGVPREEKPPGPTPTSPPINPGIVVTPTVPINPAIFTTVVHGATKPATPPIRKRPATRKKKTPPPKDG